jgi:Zn-finger nucleic acid-binding protein
VWIEGEAVAKVIGGPKSQELLGRANRQPGVCKGCEGPLEFVPNCPRCGQRAPTCPQCGTAPLPVLETLGVKVDVCGKCSGVGLDAGELEQLHEAAARYRDEGLSLRPKVRAGTPSRCASCKRWLKPEHAFVWGERFYCGSCAPTGSAPYIDELTKARPSAQPSIGRGRYGMRGGKLDDTATESTLLWLFSKLFD